MSYKHASSVAAVLVALAQSCHAQIFTVNCSPVSQQRLDPLIFPGVVSPHVHAVTGSTNFQMTEPNSVAIAGNATTCDKLLDHSNYWQPQLYHLRTDGMFELVEFQGNAAYYLDRACDYEAGRQNCDNTPIPPAPPAGLRMVVGNPMLRTYNSSDPAQRAISHVCLGRDDVPEAPELPQVQCDRIRAETFFPSCWDGVNLDSADHASHMAFPAIGDYNTGVCPQSHPKAIISVFYEFFYNTGAIQNFNKLVWAMGDPTGYGLHGDYIQGWTDQERLENAIATCTGPNGVLDKGCSLNVGADGTPGHSSVQPLQVPPVNEEIGLNGPLAKLPGNNPVTGSLKKRAVKKSF